MKGECTQLSLDKTKAFSISVTASTPFSSQFICSNSVPSCLLQSSYNACTKVIDLLKDKSFL